MKLETDCKLLISLKRFGWYKVNRRQKGQKVFPECINTIHHSFKIKKQKMRMIFTKEDTE